MSTTPVTAPSTVGAIYDPKTGTVQKTNGNQDQTNFLTLLTTQLKNQDPTNPTDTNQVTQQIALLSEVQQQTQSNGYLQQLISQNTQSQAGSAVNYIGKQIDASGNSGQLTGGKATFVYELPAGATTATVTISDKSGKQVYSGTGTTIAGRNTVIWDGSNSVTGTTMANGQYNFSVVAKDANGKDVAATTLTTGVVSAVETANGVNTLSLGNISIPLNSVLSIYNPGQPPSA